MSESAPPFLQLLYFLAIPVAFNLFLFYTRHCLSFKRYLFAVLSVLIISVAFNYLIPGISFYNCGLLCGSGTRTWPLIALAAFSCIAHSIKVTDWRFSYPYYSLSTLICVGLLQQGQWVS